MDKDVVIGLLKRNHLQEAGRVYARAYNSLKIGEVWTNARARALLNSYFKKQPDLALVAKQGGKIIGVCLALLKPWWDGNRLVEVELFIEPRFQRLGIGRRLVGELLLRAKKKYHATVFEAITFSKKEFPMSWYKRLGLKKSEKLVLIEGSVDALLKRLK